VIVNEQRGVPLVPTTGCCSRLPGDVTPSRSMQGICGTIAGNS
jgi:hypothetical protein